MKLERIQTIQRLPIQIEEAWDFFSTPKNLSLITPHWLDFRLMVDPPEYMHPGTIISASIRPIPILSVNWITEVTHIRPPHFYIVEQRFGPFKLWHHEQYFRPYEGGVEVEDRIMYGLRFGMIGTFLHNIFVRERLHEIFSHRAHALEQRFGSIGRPKPQGKAALPIEEIYLEQAQQHRPMEQPRQRRPVQQPQQPPARQNVPQQVRKPPPQQVRQQPPQGPPGPRPKHPNQPKPQRTPRPDQHQGATPGKPVPRQVTLDDIFRGTED